MLSEIGEIMEGSEEVSYDAMKSYIEFRFTRIEVCKNAMLNRRKEIQDLESRSVEEVEVSLRDELKRKTEDKASLIIQIAAEREITEQRDKEVVGIMSDKEDIERRQIAELTSYLNGVPVVASKFRDPLTNYSEDKLSEGIKQITLEGCRVRDGIANVDRESETLNSKYYFNMISTEAIPGSKFENSELRDTMAILNESKSDVILAKKQKQHSNSELEKKLQRTKRVIANLESTV